MAEKKIEATVTDTPKAEIPPTKIRTEEPTFGPDSELDRLRKKTAKLEKEARDRKGILSLQDIAPKEEVVIPPAEQYETAIRKHIKKSGGFRKGTSDANKEKTRGWLKSAGRDARSLKWDETILDGDKHKPVKK